jgi:hypothetical protein
MTPPVDTLDNYEKSKQLTSYMHIRSPLKAIRDEPSASESVAPCCFARCYDYRHTSAIMYPLVNRIILATKGKILHG